MVSGNLVQELNLQLIEQVKHNDLNGKRIAIDLRNNSLLWNGAVMKRQAYGGREADLIELRDIEADRWNVDTLYLLVQKKNLEDLLAVVRQWQAEEVDVIETGIACRMLGVGNNEARVVRVWWD